MRVNSVKFLSGLAVVALSMLTSVAQSHTGTKPVHSAPNMTPDALSCKSRQVVLIGGIVERVVDGLAT